MTSRILKVAYLSFIWLLVTVAKHFSVQATDNNNKTNEANSSPVSIAVFQDVTESSMNHHHIPVITDNELQRLIDLISNRGGRLLFGVIFAQSQNYPSATLIIPPDQLPCQVNEPDLEEITNPFRRQEKQEEFERQNKVCKEEQEEFEAYLADRREVFFESSSTILNDVRYDTEKADLAGAINRATSFHLNSDAADRHTILISDGIDERPDIKPKSTASENNIEYHLLYGTDMAKGDYLDKLDIQFYSSFSSILNRIK